ncbi:MAG: HAD family phosphatase [Nitrospirota bacterium]
MNIVFDLGRVVVRWEPDVIIAGAFADPAVRTAVRTEVIDHPDWLALDRGVLSQHDAIVRAAERTGLPIQDVAGFLTGVPHALVPIPETVDLMYRLKAAGHRLYCLSNMQVASIEHLERAYPFWDVFDGVVISCRIHLIKPEPAIYAYLLEKHGLDGADTIFVDDTVVNLEAAARFGIRTIQFENTAQCEQRLTALGCL